MKCPYCHGNEIVWDYKTGDLVCTSCGSVIDKIYSYENNVSNEDIMIIPKYVYTDFYRKIEKYKKIENKLKNNTHQIRKTIIYNGSYMKESSLSAMKLIENDEKLLILYDLMDSMPLFRSKNIRYKLAIGLYLLDRKEFNKISKNLNISDKYMKKILSKIKVKERIKIQSLLKKRIEDNLLIK